MGKVRTLALLTAAVLVPIMSGCTPASPGFWPFSMGVLTPIPVFPWVTERMQEKYCYPNDHRTLVMPPLREGFPPPPCEDPPDKAQVIRAMQRVTRGIPYFIEEFRDDIDVVCELVKDTIDPPRFFPLIGPAQLHHCHWKCIVYYTETIESGYPFPFKCVKQRVEVIYIDKDHLHLVPHGGPEAQQSIFRDTAGP